MFDKKTGLVASGLDKFSQSRLIEFDEETKSFDPTTSLFIEKVRALPVEGEYILDKWRADGRMDLISFDIYGTTRLWWVLLIYNGVYSFYDVKLNSRILYPSLNAVENVILSLKVKEGMWLK